MLLVRSNVSAELVFEQLGNPGVEGGRFEDVDALVVEAACYHELLPFPQAGGFSHLLLSCRA